MRAARGEFVGELDEQLKAKLGDQFIPLTNAMIVGHKDRVTKMEDLLGKLFCTEEALLKRSDQDGDGPAKKKRRTSREDKKAKAEGAAA